MNELVFTIPCAVCQRSYAEHHITVRVRNIVGNKVALCSTDHHLIEQLRTVKSDETSERYLIAARRYREIRPISEIRKWTTEEKIRRFTRKLNKAKRIA